MFSIIITNIEQSSQFIQKIKLLGHKIILKVLKISKPALQYAEESQALFLYMPIHTHTLHHKHTHTVQRHRIDRLPPFVTWDRAHTNFMAPQSDSKVAPALHSPHRGAPALWARCATRTARQQERRERGEERRGDALSSWTMGLSLLLMRSRCSSRFIGLLSISHVPRWAAWKCRSASRPVGQIEWDQSGTVGWRGRGELEQ